MKERHELFLPDDVRYSNDHEWARQEGARIRIGINDYAQDQLGEIVYVELPEVGTAFEKDAEFGTVESVKAVAELLLPMSGTITAVNAALADAPEAVNNAPYGDGWMVEIQPDAPEQWETLLTRDAYMALLESEE